MQTQGTNPAYTIGALLLISFWWWCSRRVKKGNLPLDWYMWPVSFVWGAGLFGLAVYDWYRRKQLKQEVKLFSSARKQKTKEKLNNS